MDSKIINNFPIRDYLAEVGIHPAKDKGYYGLYNSPFREDRNPSMKVDYEKNLCVDYGAGDGGTLIDLVMRMERCDAGQAMRLLEQKIAGAPSFSFHKETPTPTQHEPAIAIDKVQSIQNPALIDYLKERGINIYIAREHCSEVHYSVAGKPYFAIGFRNDAGGYELRNRYFKGCSTPKNITTIANGSDSVMVFEGFIDFLSYLSLKENPSPSIDITVLNSVANLAKAIPFLQEHKTVHAFLDNDESGKRAVEQLRHALPNSKVVDQSEFYRNHKDLNDHWREKCNCKPKPQIPVKKKSTGRKM